MNIYFAGSIRGGAADREHYLQLITFLKKYGTVLTEHVGDTNRSAHAEDAASITAIYEQDMGWLKQADVVIAEVTSPSLGVGYEIATAENLGKPILCLYRPLPGTSLSAMLRGSQKLKVKEYATLAEATDAIVEFLNTQKE
ncbi:MAG: nucleoside 2-deoxyribosyltransferase [Patescibacteria group bacterium]